MVMSPAGLVPEKYCAGEGQQQLQRTYLSCGQSGRLTSTNPQRSDSNKNLVLGPRWVLGIKTDWQTGRLTVGRNITLTLS
jgi:hypothetical protein